jgi:hypothetical protein
MTAYVSVFVFLFSLFAVFHQIALTFSLYWYYWWFDILMHFWGGILLGLLFYIAVKSRWFNLKSNNYLIVVWLLVVTLGWELFELMIEFETSANYLIDTITDVTMGLSGGLLVHLIARKYTMK